MRAQGSHRVWPANASSEKADRGGPERFLRKLESQKVKNETQSTLEMAGMVARFSSSALLENYQAIGRCVPGQAILPMIKANGYGHGAAWAARQLLDSPNLYGFGVATLEEGAALRSALGPSGRRVPIPIFTGATPWTEEKGRFCASHGLTPVIQTDSDWGAFLRQGACDTLPYELMFNTGMNRLGISRGLVGSVVKQLKNLSPKARPTGVFSHLAMGESPDSKLSQMQLESFRAIRGAFSATCPQTHFHLAASAGIWNQKQYGFQGLTDVVRPGLSLYGIPPWKGAPARGIRPVLTLEARVIHVSVLRAGETIGYGGTFKAKSDYRYAILAAGYADGVSRALSNASNHQANVLLSGRRFPWIGRVSMDLCAVGCAPETQVGDWAQILGPSLDAWAVAEAAGTIPYEILTSISGRVHKIYG